MLRATMDAPDFATRPTVRGYGGAVSAGHYLAAEAGARMLAGGGNAADAACAMGFALQVLEPHMNGFAGEAPILYYDAAADRVHAVSGQGAAPAAATIARFRSLGLDLVPGDGLLAAAAPAALGAWCALLERFGTRTLAEAIAPARALAERGFPVYPSLRAALELAAPRIAAEWPSTAALYLPPKPVGARQRNPALAALLGALADAARAAPGGREAGVRAARDAFYRGPPAERIEAFLRTPVRDASGEAHAGLLTAADLAAHEGSVEAPAEGPYRGARVWKCPPWSQGPVMLQQLRLLEGFDLAAMGHNGADALHAWIECAKLAFADREACYGDPAFADVPLGELLSADYAARRRALVDPARASLELRPGLGRLPEGWPLVASGADGGPPPAEPEALLAARGRGDTTHCDAADARGNLASCTPSGGWLQSSPVVPELGFPVGTRLQMAVLDPAHPNALAPGKRPRTTLTPSIAELADGRRVAFGTPGGDQQDQWSLQFLLNLAEFGFADLQAAIDAPTVHSEHWPSSFWPREARPGLVDAEDRIPRRGAGRTGAPRPPRAAQRAVDARPRHGRLLPPGRRPLRGRRLAARHDRLRHRLALTRYPARGAEERGRPMTDATPGALAEPIAALVGALIDDLNGAIADLADGELNAQAMEGHPPIGFHHWHVLRTADNIVNFVFHRDRPVWVGQRLHEEWDMPRIDQGTGMERGRGRGDALRDRRPRALRRGRARRRAPEDRGDDGRLPDRYDSGPHRREDDRAPPHRHARPGRPRPRLPAPRPDPGPAPASSANPRPRRSAGGGAGAYGGTGVQTPQPRL